tara:strand:+ start:26 stop:241 length:216 start_codon:yes stop_codon:yes gene_type:complete
MKNNMKNKTNEELEVDLSLVSHSIEMGYLGVNGCNVDRQACMDVIKEAIRRITYLNIKGVESETITKKLGY